MRDSKFDTFIGCPVSVVDDISLKFTNYKIQITNIRSKCRSFLGLVVG